MKTLAIGCHAKEVSVALLDEQTILNEINSVEFVKSPEFQADKNSPPIPPGKGSASLLAPMIHRILKDSSLAATQVDLIAVTRGPGSFTSLRVGVVTARTMAYVIGAELVGVNTLEVAAANVAASINSGNDGAANGATASGATIRCVVNAQRGQLFGSTYSIRFAGGNESVDADHISVEQLDEMQLFDRRQWLDSLQPGTIVGGPGLGPMEAELAQMDVVVAAVELRDPTAAQAGLLAVKKFRSGLKDDPFELQPIYFRPSYADEKTNG